ncbi:MAG: 6-carboxytetrahydropterin synthase [Pseudomonadota bacterium]
MFTISKAFSFCYGHRLKGDKGKCKNLHGHTAKVVLYLEAAALDENGMVCHFDDLKNSLGKWINDNLDHALLLAQDDPLVPILKPHNEKIYLLEGRPTAENIAKLIHDQAQDMGHTLSKVEVWESETSRAVYQP